MINKCETLRNVEVVVFLWLVIWLMPDKLTEEGEENLNGPC